MNTIAIDCGNSFLKIGLFEEEDLTSVDEIPSPSIKEDVDIFCTDKVKWILDTTLEYLKKHTSSVQEAMLCIDNEMHGFILAFEDGMPYTDYVSWKREFVSSDRVKDFLNNSLGEERARKTIHRTGMPIRSGLPASTLFWMHEKGYLTGQGKLYFYTLGDYLIKMITGKEPVCHPTNAAATGLFDLDTGSWNEELISLLTGGSDIVFPPVGNTAFDCRYENMLIHALPAIGDQQAALLGSGLKHTDELSFNMGTGAQVTRLVKSAGYSDDYQTRPYFFGYYLKTIPHIPSGRAINVYFRFIKDVYKRLNPGIEDEKVWRIIKESVSEDTLEKTELSVDPSFFENAVTDHTLGSINNISEYGLNLESLISGLFYRLKENFLIVSDKVNKGLPEYNKIIFSGGIAKRWNVLRNEIVKGLHSDARVILSENDTLFGCLHYARMDEKER